MYVRLTLFYLVAEIGPTDMLPLNFVVLRRDGKTRRAWSGSAKPLASLGFLFVFAEVPSLDGFGFVFSLPNLCCMNHRIDNSSGARN